MARPRTVPALLLVASAGCVRSGPDTGADSVSEAPDACTTCALSDENNFQYTSSLDLTVFALAEEADVRVDWSGLTRTVRGGALDPVAGVDDVWLVVFQDTEPAALMEAIAQDRMQQESVTLFVTCTPIDAMCAFSDFSFMGNDLGVAQYFTEGRGSWLVVLNSQAEGIVQSMALLQAAADATETTVRLADGDAALTATVDLHSLTPVVVPAGTPELVADWSGLTRDGLGNALTTYTLDRMLVGRYTAPLAELEAGFFELETAAAETWELDVSGRTSASLQELAGATPFTGVTAADTWLLALMCGSCENPSPRFLTRLAPEEP